MKITGKISGKVQKGSGRGKGLGFPTLNLEVDERARPETGVYAVRVWLEGLVSGARSGVMHVGPRPSFDEAESTVEIHVFNFDVDLDAGAEVDFKVAKKLREVRKFGSPEELVAQIQIDVEQAKEFF